MTERPVVRLRPKRGSRLREGAPWAFADEIVMDRRTKALAPGSLVRLEDDARQPLGTAGFNPGSKIAARMLDPDPGAAIGADWFARRLAAALSLREALFDAPWYRLAHAEADGLPGVIVDRYGDAAVIQPNAAWAEALVPDLAAALARAMPLSALVLNGQSRARASEGLPERLELLSGTLAGPVAVPMNGATYFADLLGGQKTGFYYDQRPNHAFAARLGRGRAVLDVYAHAGGFALAALAAGAASALAVDSSAPALDLARRGAEATGVADRFATRKGDAFAVMESLAGEGARFGLVTSDPPAFAPAKAALEAGLRAYAKAARLAAALVEPGGFLVLCSCSHAVGADAFREAVLAGAARAGRNARILHQGGAGPDHLAHPALAETSYLKALFLRLDG